MAETHQAMTNSRAPRLQPGKMLPGRFGLGVPDPSEYLQLNNGESADGLLEYFRALSAINGLPTRLSPHEKYIELPPSETSVRPGPLRLWSSYRGLSDADLLARKTALQEYRKQREASMVSPERIGRPRLITDPLLRKLLDAIPDVSGTRGVETYALHTPRPDGTFPSRMKAASWLLIHHSHHLVASTEDQDEGKVYGLPTQIKNSSAYVFRGGPSEEQTYAFLDGVPLYEARSKLGFDSFESLYDFIHADVANTLST